MSDTYLNPVYPHAAPDPFVLKYCGQYWAYVTGLQPDGRAFGILHSPDLVHWELVGSALDPLPGGHTCYWAPEVSYLNGVFYLYYSVGNEETMHIRCATSAHPGGPFLDAGRQLTNESFAIDAHVFEDEDGSRWLFYAIDFLEVGRVGTGTVMDRMLDPFTLAGSPRPVTRAGYDWQIYDPARVEKGGVRWHTLEGPFVLKHKGRYYQMFSGGNWKNVSYGVSYAYTDRLDAQEEWQQICDGESVLPILRSMPELGVVGPGHNSVVRGLDNQELFCIYHRWHPETEERVLAIDRMGWEGRDLLVYGPSATPQPAPRLPEIAGFSQFVMQRGAQMGGAELGASQTNITQMAGIPSNGTQESGTQSRGTQSRGPQPDSGVLLVPPNASAALGTAALANLHPDNFLLEVSVRVLSALPGSGRESQSGRLARAAAPTGAPDTAAGELASLTAQEAPLPAVELSGGSDPLGPAGEPGLYLGDGYANDVRLLLSSTKGMLLVQTSAEHSQLPLPAGFDPHVFHLLRVEGHSGQMRVALDGRPLYSGPLPLRGLRQVACFAQGAAAAFAGFALSIPR